MNPNRRDPNPSVYYLAKDREYWGRVRRELAEITEGQGKPEMKEKDFG